MHEPGREIEIGRNIRMIEWLKTELISGVAQVYKQLPKGRDDLLASALAGVEGQTKRRRRPRNRRLV